MQSAVLALLTLLGLCFTGGAQAQLQAKLSPKARESQVQTAREPAAANATSVAAREAFAAGRFREALDLYQRAYELTGAPILLYEIAQSADRLRLNATTLRAFELYLQRYPDAPNRDEVRNRIAALEPKVRTEAADLDAESARVLRTRPPRAAGEMLMPSPYARSAPAPGPRAEPLIPSPYTAADSEPPAPASKPVWREPWFWVGTGAAALALTALVIVVAGSSSASHSGSAPTSP